MNSLKSLSTKVLALFVKDVAAGACHPELGFCCGLFTHRRRSCAGHCYISGHCA